MQHLHVHDLDHEFKSQSHRWRSKLWGQNFDMDYIVVPYTLAIPGVTVDRTSVKSSRNCRVLWEDVSQTVLCPQLKGQGHTLCSKHLSVLRSSTTHYKFFGFSHRFCNSKAALGGTPGETALDTRAPSSKSYCNYHLLDGSFCTADLALFP